MTKESPINSGEQHFEEHDVTVRWSAFSHHLDFEAKEDTLQPDGSHLYSWFDKDGCQEFGSEFERGERFVEGTVKWDGCSHLNFGDKNGYLHLCGARCFNRLTFVLTEMFKMASREVPAFYPECAELTLLRAGTPSQADAP